MRVGTCGKDVLTQDIAEADGRTCEVDMGRMPGRDMRRRDMPGKYIRVSE